MSLPEKAAVLGLGIIGSRAFSRLGNTTCKVACWNRTPKNLSGETATPKEAIDGATVISIYLKDSQAVREVVTQIASACKPGQIIVNHSTVDLETTKWLEAVCLDLGCRFLDAPFTGSKIAAGNGQLIYYIGGDSVLADALDPYLSLTSKSRLYCGPVGAATVVKLSTNLISACTVQAMAEALAITTTHGVSAECLIRAVAENVSGSPLAAMKFPSMVVENFETHFSLANMGKDTRYMLALAESAGLSTPAIAAVSQRLADLCDAGHGELDYSALAKPYIDAQKSLPNPIHR